MDSHQKLFVESIFKNIIYSTEGQAFEDLFCKIMQLKFSKFEKVQAYGKIGDGKNDGYFREEGIYYQVYAPRDITDKNTVYGGAEKYYNNFIELYENWNSHYEIKRYYFVVNDKYKELNKKFHENRSNLEKEYSEVKFDFYLAKDLQQELFSLDETNIYSVLGWVPNPLDLSDERWWQISEIAWRLPPKKVGTVSSIFINDLDIICWKTILYAMPDSFTVFFASRSCFGLVNALDSAIQGFGKQFTDLRKWKEYSAEQFIDSCIIIKESIVNDNNNGFVINTDNASHNTITSITRARQEHFPNSALVINLYSPSVAKAIQLVYNAFAFANIQYSEMFTLVCPGEKNEDANCSPSGNSDDFVSVERLSELVERRMNSCFLESSPSIQDISSCPDNTAFRLVEELNNRSEMALMDETILLLKVRDWVPELWQKLLEEHARNRNAPAIIASLKAALLLRRDLALWLNAFGTMRFLEIFLDNVDSNVSDGRSVLFDMLTKQERDVFFWELHYNRDLWCVMSNSCKNYVSEPLKLLIEEETNCMNPLLQNIRDISATAITIWARSSTPVGYAPELLKMKIFWSFGLSRASNIKLVLQERVHPEKRKISEYILSQTPIAAGSNELEMICADSRSVVHPYSTKE